MIKETNLIPNSKTFTAILTGCSHLGLIEEAKHYFNLMKEKFNIQPNIYHYNCMVDLFSRKGKLDRS